MGAKALLKLSRHAAQVRDCCQDQPKYLRSSDLSGILFENIDNQKKNKKNTSSSLGLAPKTSNARLTYNYFNVF